MTDEPSGSSGASVPFWRDVRVLAVVSQFVFLAIVLRKTVPLFPFRQTMGFLARVALVAVIVGGGVHGAKILVNRVLKDTVPAAKIEMAKAMAKAKASAKASAPTENEAKPIRFNKEFFADRDIAISSKLMLLKATILGITGAVLLLLASWALGVREPLTIATWILKKFKILRN